VKRLYENNRVTFYRSKQVYYYYEAHEFCKSLAKYADLARMKSAQEFSSVVDQLINNSDEWKLEPVWDSVNYPGKSPSTNAWYHGIGVIQSVRSENGRSDTFVYEDDTEILFYDFETSFNFARSCIHVQNTCQSGMTVLFCRLTRAGNTISSITLKTVIKGDAFLRVIGISK